MVSLWHKLLVFQKRSINIDKKTNTHRKNIIIFILLAALTIGTSFLYIFSRTYAKAWRIGVAMSPIAFESILARTLPHLYGMIASAIMLALLSVVFQTITQSRVLTPSMIGFDSVFVGTQTVLVFMFGTSHILFANPYVNYTVTASIMIIISMAMFGFILRSSRNNLVFLLMFGIILSGVIGSGTRYLQIIMNESDFIQVAAATSVNINNMNVNIINMAIPLMAIVAILIFWSHKKYNVMSLGPDHAKGLGIDYEKEITKNLIIISIGMSITTALIGSLTFLGLLAVNAAREIFKTHKHITIFIGSSIMAAFAIVLGQSIMELLEGAVPVTAIIDFVGSAYIFYLILKGNKI